MKKINIKLLVTIFIFVGLSNRIMPVATQEEILLETNLNSQLKSLSISESLIGEKVKTLEAMSEEFKEKIKLISDVIEEAQTQESKKAELLTKDIDTQSTDLKKAVTVIETAKSNKEKTEAFETAVTTAEKVQQNAEKMSISLSIIAGLGSLSTVVLGAMGVTIGAAVATAVATATLIIGIVGKLSMAVQTVAELHATINHSAKEIKDPELQGRIKNSQKMIEAVKAKMDILDKKCKEWQSKFDKAKNTIENTAKTTISTIKTKALGMQKELALFKSKLTGIFSKKQEEAKKELAGEYAKKLQVTVTAVQAAQKLKRKADTSKQSKQILDKVKERKKKADQEKLAKTLAGDNML